MIFFCNAGRRLSWLFSIVSQHSRSDPRAHTTRAQTTQQDWVFPYQRFSLSLSLSLSFDYFDGGGIYSPLFVFIFGFHLRDKSITPEETDGRMDGWTDGGTLI